MKLLLIGPKVTDINDVRNFSGVWSYYLNKEFAKLGIDMCFVPRNEASPQMELQGADHILALGTRAFDKLPDEIGKTLMSRLAKNDGLVSQIHDGATRMSPCHVTFHLKPFVNRYPTRNANHWIGWAADPDIFYPEQPDNVLNILIDHSQLAGGRAEDYSSSVWTNVQRLVKSRSFDGYNGVIVRRIVDGGVEAIHDLKDKDWPRYKRQTIPILEVAKAYRSSHLFLTTHPESVGLSILETSMCGALPIVRDGSCDPYLLKSIRAARYIGERIPWEEVLGMISIRSSVETARKNSWWAVAERIANYLTNAKGEQTCL